MIRCLVIDDEPPALAILADYIGQVPFLTLAGTTTDPVEGLTWVQQGRADLVFLDIQMPRLTGLQFLRLTGHKARVVLTTAYPEYALAGYENDVVDYLLKPIAFERFLKAAHKALTLLAPTVPALVTSPLLPAVPPAPAVAPTSDYLFVKGDTKNKYLRVSYADIRYVEGLNNYVLLHLLHERVTTYQTLRELADNLPQPPFMRVHKSFVVNLNHVRLLDGNALYVQDKLIPVSNTYREALYRVVRG